MADLKQFNDSNDLKVFLAQNYMAQIKNFFGGEKRALKFMSSIMADVQRNPKLLECTPASVVNAYITMAQLGFMPSGVSGEGYVLPYQNSRKVGDKWEKTMEAQFQLGYQGLVTLFYKAGIKSIVGGIVREKDKTTNVNGNFKHRVDLKLSQEERGAAVGAYVGVKYEGEWTWKYMNGKDILAHAAKFSKSYDPAGKYSPWNPENDPELTMWIKTVLKQFSKLLPKNETINQAIAEDNRDSILADRLEEAEALSSGLKMGSLLVDGKGKTDKDEAPSAEGGEGETTIKRD